MQLPEIENMQWWIAGTAVIGVLFTVAGVIRYRTFRKFDSGDYCGVAARKERILLDWTYPVAFATLFFLLATAAGLPWPMRILALMVGLTAGCLVEVVLDAQPDKQIGSANRKKPPANKPGTDAGRTRSCDSSAHAAASAAD